MAIIHLHGSNSSLPDPNIKFMPADNPALRLEPKVDNIAIPFIPNPAAPMDCRVDTIPPETTGPNLDIIKAAYDPFRIPLAVNPRPATPIAPKGTAATPPTITIPTKAPYFQ